MNIVKKSPQFIFDNPRIIKYSKSWVVEWYIWHQRRTPLLDQKINQVFLDNWYLEDAFAQFLCSKKWRHLWDELISYDDIWIIDNLINYTVDSNYTTFLQNFDKELRDQWIQDIQYLESKPKKIIKNSFGLETF